MAQGFALTYPQVANHVAVLIDLRDFLEESDIAKLPDKFHTLTREYPGVHTGVGKRLLRMRSDLSKNEKARLVRDFRSKSGRSHRNSCPGRLQGYVCQSSESRCL